MNRRQKIVMAIGIGLACFMLLFLPIYNVNYGEAPDGPTFYIFVLRLLGGFTYFDTALDFGRLAFELLVVAVITVAGCVIFRNRRHGSPGRKADLTTTVTEAEPPAA